MANESLKMLGINDIFKSIYNHKFGIIIFSIVGALLAYCAALYIPPRYEGDALILVGPDSTNGVPSSPLRQAEIVNSKVRIASSDEVIQDAIEQYGSSKLVVSIPVKIAPDLQKEWVVAQVRNNITVKSEPSTDVIRINYKSQSDIEARDFTNILTNSFLKRHIEIFAKPGEANFIAGEKMKYDAQFKIAANALAEFEKNNKLYSAEEQRILLLRRLSEAHALVSKTTGSVAQMEAGIKSIGSQLQGLRAVISSPYVSSLVADVTRQAQSSPSEPTTSTQTASQLGSAPPLLLVKVYQNSVESLVKYGSDLSGERALLKEQEKQISLLDSELERNGHKETDYAVLKREVSLAASRSELYSKKAAEAEFEANFNAAKFSNLKIIQQAVRPLNPSFPRRKTFAALGALVGAVLASIFAVTRDYDWSSGGALRDQG